MWGLFFPLQFVSLCLLFCLYLVIHCYFVVSFRLHWIFFIHCLLRCRCCLYLGFRTGHISRLCSPLLSILQTLWVVCSLFVLVLLYIIQYICKIVSFGVLCFLGCIWVLGWVLVLYCCWHYINCILMLVFWLLVFCVCSIVPIR